MGLINTFPSYGEATPFADPLDETVINGGPYHSHQGTANSATAFGPDGEIPEEIKRRQISLLVSYVMAMRVR
jgi:hypothetical protein